MKRLVHVRNKMLVGIRCLTCHLAPKARRSSQSLGQLPQDYLNPNNPGAESAIHFAQFESTRQLNRAFSARFRGDLNSWGDAPG